MSDPNFARESSILRGMGARHPHRLAVAPLMGWTDRHFRYFLRLISREAWLYSEMLPVQTLLLGPDPARRLHFHPAEHPVALQLGGDDPALLQRAAKWAWEAGYDEINLNIGCPSPRVLKGGFGVCLMETPERVGSLVSAIRDVVPIPVTVKCRLGFDQHVHPAFLETFVQTVAEQGCRTFIVHARAAWLGGFNPRANRVLPPLDYEPVMLLKQKYPGLEIVINGGITQYDEAMRLLGRVDGVMIGRKILEDPFWLVHLEAGMGWPHRQAPSRMELVKSYGSYVSDVFRSPAVGPCESRQRLFQPFLTVIRGFPGAKRLRQMVCEAGRGSRSEGCLWIERIVEQFARLDPHEASICHPYPGSLPVASSLRTTPAEPAVTLL